MNARKKMMLVSYLFPPIGGGGVTRAVKMARYLAESGWEVHVLTVESAYYATKDESLLKEFPKNVIIHRAKEWNPLSGVRAARSQKSAGAQTQPEANEKQPPSQPGLKQRIKKQAVASLKSLKNTLMIPDDMIGWLPDAVKVGEQVIRQHHIPILFSTSGPYTCHLVARNLKRKTGIKWIADFRDPWTQNMHRTGIAWREAWEERMERSVMREADAVTTVTNGFADNFQKKFGQEISRIEVIHNGFDPNDYTNIEQLQDDGKFTCIYTGILYRERNPRLLLEAVAQLIEEKKVDRKLINLQFAGVFDYPGYTDNIDCVRRFHLEDIVEIMGNLPHKKALAAMKAADTLLLIGDTAPGSGVYIPGKLYEYMAINHPILALSVEGESTKIIERFALGEVVDPKDVNQIKTAFLQMYQEWKSQQMERERSAAKQEHATSHDHKNDIIQRAFDGDLAIYNRQIQARQLGELMEQLMERLM